MSLVVGIDIGATWLKAALADGEGRILYKKAERTNREGEELLSQLLRLAGELVARAGPSNVSAVGIGAVGPLDLASGAIVNPPNLPIGRLEVVGPLREALNLPVYLLNDCTAACYGEWVFGAGRGHDNVAHVALGTGIGGGAVVDGHLLLGEGGNAAEVGHFVVDAQGRLKCGCGGRGHWEAYCSGTGIPRFLGLWAREVGIDLDGLSRALKGKGADQLTAEEALELARRVPDLAGFLEELARLNAIGLALVACAFSPSIITIGGSVALGNPDIALSRAMAYLPDFAFRKVPKTSLTPLGGDAALYGAIALALRPPEGVGGADRAP